MSGWWHGAQQRARPPATLLFLALIWVGLGGCNKEEPTAPTLPQVAKGAGSVSGRVALTGSPPEMKTRAVTCNPSGSAAKIEVTDRTVRVSATGGLADVYVYVKDGPRGSGGGEPAVVMDQVDCQFEPHAIGVQIGQSIRFRNSDPAFHNVHWDGGKNSSKNLSFTAAPAPERIEAFTTAELLAIRCDVHDWMKGSIAVFDNPFFAVTDADGKYAIKGLPAGTYTVAAWHPFYGAAGEQKVVVGGGEADGVVAGVEFTFK